VCGIFGHIARHCRNREEKRGLSMPQNKFEVLKDRVMQRGEGSGREIGKDRREILREEREKKGKKIMAQKKGQGKKKVDDEIESEKKAEKDEGQRWPKIEKIEIEKMEKKKKDEGQ